MSGRSRRTAELRREEILTATLEVVESAGLAATRVSDVATALGVSPALVFYHFRTKDDLIAEAFAHAAERDVARLEEIAASEDAPLDRLRRMLKLYGPTGSATGWQLWIDAWALAHRELEFLLGYKRKDMDFGKLYGETSAGYAGVKRRLAERSLLDHFYDFLEHRGAKIPPDIKNRDITTSNTPDERIQAGILELYQSHPDVGILFELMTDFDEGLQEWRYRHVKAVERTIGNKKGTGGSLGVEFLKKSLFQPIFPDLWAIRHQL